MRALGSPGAGVVVPFDAAAGAALGAAGAAIAAARWVSSTPRSSDPAGPSAGAGLVGVAATCSDGPVPCGVAASTLRGSTATTPSGSVVAWASMATGGGASAPPSSAVSMTAISALLGTVAPSSTRISLSTPAYGEGTSAFTLSVMTSRSGSYFATVSPGCLSHRPTVPSATDSPSWGIVTFAPGRFLPDGAPRPPAGAP